MMKLSDIQVQIVRYVAFLQGDASNIKEKINEFIRRAEESERKRTAITLADLENLKEKLEVFEETIDEINLVL